MTEWIRCPICGSKTRNRIREDTPTRKRDRKTIVTE
ncbi:hypothetical protein D3Z36_07570 [Lachnospiraceae bacterium]|nr:hypothetical protein [Lachnospiraceae bacterium]